MSDLHTTSFNRDSLITAIGDYRSPYPHELAFREAFLRLLEHPRPFFRDHMPGHITASAWIVNADRNAALLTHHMKLDRWLQSGGHADGDEDVLNVASREASEETGLGSLQVLSPRIFDIDIHTIPARGDVPRHDHYDVRFLLTADDHEVFTVTPESKALAWVAAGDLAQVTGNNESMLRMAEKVWNLL